MSRIDVTNGESVALSESECERLVCLIVLQRAHSSRRRRQAAARGRAAGVYGGSGSASDIRSRRLIWGLSRRGGGGGGGGGGVGSGGRCRLARLSAGARGEHQFRAELALAVLEEVVETCTRQAHV
jgi:hypothetical protein